MRIVQAIEGVERTSGVSLFCVEVANRVARQGHASYLVYSVRYEFKPCGEVKAVCAPTGNLDVLGFKPDLVHMHGIWSMFNVNVMKWCRSNGVPYVVSPHGCFMPNVMRKGFLKKHIFVALYHRLFNGAAALHATVEAERVACRRLLLNAPCVLATLGVDLNEGGKSKKGKSVLFVGRVSPEKGLDGLLSAWKSLDHKGWQLVIAGPSWFGYGERLQSRCKAEGIGDVTFPGALLGESKDAAYRSAGLFVLPSVSENFGVVVPEAMAFCTPVIATRGTPWQELEAHRAGWWVDPDVESLRKAVAHAIALPDGQLGEMGRNARKLVEDKYTWDKALRPLFEKYDEICQ